MLYYVSFPCPKKVCEFSSNFKNVLFVFKSTEEIAFNLWVVADCMKWKVEIILARKTGATK